MSEPVRTAVVRFRIPGDYLKVDAGDLHLQRHDEVLVQTERGPSVGTVLMVPEPTDAEAPPHKILRRLIDEDRRSKNRTAEREDEALDFCKSRARALDLPIKIVAVELAHSGARATFYFTSPQRVDFRALVKDLARRFHTRIEMRQIGVRDAARYTGGTGVCGRELCCSTWLPEFQPVSIRMAKDQNLTLNQEKLSGLCGRLRCCLRYEQELYKEAKRGLPKLGKLVTTPQGTGRVRDLSILEGRVFVALDGGDLTEFQGHEIQLAPTPTETSGNGRAGGKGKGKKGPKKRSKGPKKN